MDDLPAWLREKCTLQTEGKLMKLPGGKMAEVATQVLVFPHREVLSDVYQPIFAARWWAEDSYEARNEMGTIRYPAARKNESSGESQSKESGKEDQEDGEGDENKAAETKPRKPRKKSKKSTGARKAPRKK